MHITPSYVKKLFYCQHNYAYRITLTSLELRLPNLLNPKLNNFNNCVHGFVWVYLLCMHKCACTAVYIKAVSTEETNWMGVCCTIFPKWGPFTVLKLTQHNLNK